MYINGLLKKKKKNLQYFSVTTGGHNKSTL